MHKCLRDVWGVVCCVFGANKLDIAEEGQRHPGGAASGDRSAWDVLIGPSHCESWGKFNRTFVVLRVVGFISGTLPP